MVKTAQFIKNLLSALFLHRGTFDLTQINWFMRLIKHRAFQWAVILPNLFIFILVVVSGFVGTPVGNMNFSIVLVWMVWWFALMMIMVPLFSRLWCMICPLPAFGDWLQRRRMIWKIPGFKFFGANRSWPAPIKNLWPVNFIFLFIATFILLLTTRPVVTAILLSTLFILGTVLALPYAKRAFCRYVCPVGGFLGLYSMFASFEIRPKDTTLCLHHSTKECVKGSDTSFGCPWLIYPGGLERNNFCGLCMECIKACPYNNLAVTLRPFAKDLLAKTGRTLDEAYKAFIMLALAVVYISITQGPWGVLRDWGNVFYKPTYGFALAGLEGFAIHTAIVWGSSLLLLPGIFYGFTWLSWSMAKTKVSMRKLFTDFSYGLIPIGLAAWIGFSLPIILVNWSYVLSVISDPFGWGWNLFGTRDVAWSPMLPELIPYLQLTAVVIGLVYSIYYGLQIARQNYTEKRDAVRVSIPQAAFLILVSVLLIWLFTG